MDTILNSADLSAALVALMPALLAIIAIALAFKGIDLAKRGIKKASEPDGWRRWDPYDPDDHW